jgi:hypothetical protein
MLGIKFDKKDFNKSVKTVKGALKSIKEYVDDKVDSAVKSFDEPAKPEATATTEAKPEGAVGTASDDKRLTELELELQIKKLELEILKLKK